MRVSLFEHRKSNVPRALDLSWDQLAEELRTPAVCPDCQGHACPRKLAGPLWSPAEYPPGATRGNKNVQGVSVLAYDVDHPTEEYAQQVVANVDALGVANIVHGTHAFHELGSFRVILRLERPATPGEYPALWRAGFQALVADCPTLEPGRGLDETCTDLARAYFLPSVAEGHEYVFRAQDGESISLVGAECGAAAKPCPPPQSAPASTLPPPQPVDMRALRAELKRSQHPLMPIILKGEPLAVHGERDDALISAAGALYGRVAPSIPPEALLEILRPSLGAMDFEPEGLAHWEAVALEKLQRAQLWSVERERQYQEKNRPWVGADGREMFARKREEPERKREAETAEESADEDPPERWGVAPVEQPPIVYVYGWNKYVLRRNGKWDLLTPLEQKAAAHYLRSEVLPDLLATMDPTQPEYASYANLKTLPAHPLVAAVHGLDCAPGQPQMYSDAEGRLQLNLWVPPTIVPQPGDWSSLRRILAHLTADGGAPDADAQAWVLHWMAAKVQNPLATRGTAPIFVGTPGTGKSTLIRAFQETLGPGNCITLNPDALESSFNGHFAGKLFVFADDCTPMHAHRDLSGKLKTAITGAKVVVNSKGVNQLEVTNRAVWAFASNHPDPIWIEKDDRRYSMFENRAPVTEEYKEMTRALFDQTHPNVPSPKFLAEMAAFAYDLHTLEVDYDMLHEPFWSRTRQASIRANLDSVDAFAEAVEEYGFQPVALSVEHALECPPRAREVPNGVIGAQTATYVFAVYAAWCEQNGFKPVSANKLGRRLSVAPGWKRGKHANVHVYWIPQKGTGT